MRVFNAQPTNSESSPGFLAEYYVMAKDSRLRDRRRRTVCNYGENKGESMIDDSIANFKLQDSPQSFTPLYLRPMTGDWKLKNLGAEEALKKLRNRSEPPPNKLDT